MSRHHPEGKPAPYELRIHGLLGPVLLAALPFTAVASVPRETVRSPSRTGTSSSTSFKRS